MARARTDEAKDTRRSDFLRAALDEFFEKGFAAARLEDVARRAGLSKGAIYLYFDSKDALFRALVESLVVPKIDALEMIARQSGTIRMALDGLSAFAPVAIRETDLPRLMKVLIGDSQTFPEIVTAYRREVLDRIIGLISEVIRAAVARGEIEPVDANLTARLVMGPIVLSGIWQALFGNDPEAQVDLDALFRLHRDFLLRALNVKEPSA